MFPEAMFPEAMFPEATGGSRRPRRVRNTLSPPETVREP